MSDINLDWFNHVIHRPFCSDSKPMTPKRICQIIHNTKRPFKVTWHYRNNNFRKQVRTLCKQRILRPMPKHEQVPGATAYIKGDNFDIVLKLLV